MFVSVLIKKLNIWELYLFKVNILIISNEETLKYLNELSENNKEEEMNKTMNKLEELSITSANLEEILANLEVNEMVELKNDVSEIFKDNKLIKSYMNKIDISDSSDAEQLKNYISKIYESSDKYMPLLKLVASKDEMNALNNLIANKINEYQNNDKLSEVDTMNEYQSSDKSSDISNINQEKISENILTASAQNSDVVEPELLALNTNPANELNYNTFTSFMFIFGLLTLLISILLTIKNVRKSRTK